MTFLPDSFALYSLWFVSLKISKGDISLSGIQDAIPILFVTNRESGVFYAQFFPEALVAEGFESFVK
jgi:hypothetical protein